MKVRLVKPKSVKSISNLSCLIECYDGKSDIVPKSLMFYNARGLWIPEFLLEKKNIQYSSKTAAVNPKTKEFKSDVTIYYHKPKPITKKVQHDRDLFK